MGSFTQIYNNLTEFLMGYLIVVLKKIRQR